MRRSLLIVGLGVVACGAASHLLLGSIFNGMPADGLALFTAAATLFLAAAAAGFGWRALKRSNDIASELDRLARSIDGAIKDLSGRSDRDRAMLVDLDARVAGELQLLSGRISPEGRLRDSPPGANPPNGVPYSPVRRGRQAANAQLPDGAGVEAALLRTMMSGRAELSLQPIISVESGAAGGFEVHVHLEPEGGQPIDIRRLQRPVPGVDTAAFERLVVVSAVEAARRRLGDASERMPLHVAVSDALLKSRQELDAVLGLFRQYPALAKSVVLSLPVETLESGQHGDALDLLGPLDVRLAAEGWSGAPEGMELFRRAGVDFLKLPVDRLLDRTKSRKVGASAGMVLETASAAAIEVIATDVRSDEDAVGLLDLGVDLMTGARFSGPRRLKPDGSTRPGRVQRL